MITLVTEIINKNVEYKGFYNPAVKGFKKQCRTEKTKFSNMKKLINAVLKSDFIKDLRILEYNEQKELIECYTKDDLYDLELM